MMNYSDYSNNAIEVSRLTVTYNSKPVLDNVDLTLPRGKLAAIIGPNGAGKTTLVKAILGLIPKVEGEIVFPELGGKKPKIGYVPQSESIDWDFPVSVLDVAVMGCFGRLGWVKRPTRDDKNFALQMLKKTGMEQYAGRQISQLSGGQQQRVFIARALVQKADIYIMDEPFKGVDADTERSIIALLKELRTAGKTVVAVHHDLATVKDYFDHVTLINTKVIANGEVEKVFTDENLDLTYRRSGKAGREQ